MADQFSEHLDSDYFDFLKVVLAYDEDRIHGLIEQYKKSSAQVVVIANSRDKRLFLKTCYQL